AFSDGGVVSLNQRSTSAVFFVLDRLVNRSKVGRFGHGREGPGLAEPLDSDPGHEAGEWSKTALFRMGGNPGQLEHLLRDLGIELRLGDLHPLFAGGLGEAATERLEPGIHLDAKLPLTVNPS